MPTTSTIGSFAVGCGLLAGGPLDQTLRRHVQLLVPTSAAWEEKKWCMRQGSGGILLLLLFIKEGTLIIRVKKQERLFIKSRTETGAVQVLAGPTDIVVIVYRFRTE
jgi:hypothetical protein